MINTDRLLEERDKMVKEIKDLKDTIHSIYLVLGTGQLCEHACEGCKVDVEEASFIAADTVKKYNLD